MATAYSPKIVTDGLLAYFDVNNPKCVDASQTIDTNTRLKNLVRGGSTIEMQSRTETASYGNMSFVKEGGIYVYDQNGINGGEPGWKSTLNYPRVDDFTFICWFKYNYGSEYQRSDNIYGGGFSGRTSFYLSPGGTSSSHGALRYSDAGSANAYGVYLPASAGGNDGFWHMFAAVDSGGDGDHTTKVYIDGILKGSGTSNASYDTPDGTGRFTWGSWSETYGNMNARSNCYSYYERALTDKEIMQNYIALKDRFTL